MPPLKRTVLVVALVFLWPQLSHAQPLRDDSSQPRRARLKLCLDVTGLDVGWFDNVVRALGRVRALVYTGDLSFEIEDSRGEPCHLPEGVSCYGEPGLVRCSTNKLARLLAAIGWISSAQGTIQTLRGKDRPSYTDWNASTAMEAFSTVDLAGAGNARMMDMMLEAVRKSHVMREPMTMQERLSVASTYRKLQSFDAGFDESERVPDSIDPALLQAYLAYRAAGSNVLSFIVGHEMAHAQRTCAVEAPAWGETSGAFQHFADMQTDGDGLCSSLINQAELNADRCAMRVVSIADNHIVPRISAQDPRILPVLFPTLSFARRTAIDVLDWILQLGLGSSTLERVSWDLKGAADGMPTLIWKYLPPQGYLYSAIRLALFSEQLHHDEPFNPAFVAICDETAQLFVNALSYTVAGCNKGEGNLDLRAFVPAFGAYVPAGVVKAWAGEEKWNDATTFRCGPSSAAPGSVGPP